MAASDTGTESAPSAGAAVPTRHSASANEHRVCMTVFPPKYGPASPEPVPRNIMLAEVDEGRHWNFLRIFSGDGFYGLISRSEEPTSELQSLMRISYAVFCLNKQTTNQHKLPTSALYEHSK